MRVRLIAIASGILGVGLAAFSAFSFPPQSAQATSYNIMITLGEAQAVSTCPSNPPPAMGGGSGTVTYDDVTNMLSWNITFSNLSGAPIAAHFHGPAVPASDAGIQVTIGDLSSPSVGSQAISEAQEAELLGGLWYINYHTSACGGGEIRGQVSGNGVGGVTELTNPEIAPITTSVNSDRGMWTGLAAAIGAVALVGASGALLFARRLMR